MSEPRELLVKQVILRSLQEKRDVKGKELEAMRNDARVRQYIELVAGLDLLDEAIKHMQLDVAKTSVHARPMAKPTARPLRGELLARISRRGVVLAVYKEPYSAMLNEFRGKIVNVKDVQTLLRKRFGLRSKPVAEAYLHYARERKLVEPVKLTSQGHVLRWQFPIALGIEEAETDPRKNAGAYTMDELRKAGVLP